MTSRMTNTKYNLYTSVIYQLISAILNIVVRKIFLEHFGLYFLSLDGYFSNIITMLNLLDLGIGTSSMYFLAKAYAANDDEDIYVTYITYRKLYKILALVLTIFGLGVCIFIGNLVDIGGYDINYIRLIYLLTFARTIAFYLMSTSRNTLQFSQRNYINMIINIVCVLSFSALRIASIFIFENYTLYVVLLLVEMCVSYLASRYFYHKDIKPCEVSEAKINNKIKEILAYGKKLIVVNINNFIFNSTDNLIINEILGINYIGLMSNYYMIVNSVTLFANQILESAHASIYNFLNDQHNSQENALNLLNTLSFISFIIASFCGICLFGLTNEFIGIMYGKQYVLNYSVILLFVLNLVVLMFQSPLTAYSNGKGLVKFEIRYSTMMAIVNLLVSVVLGKIIGINGILVGTLLANLIMTFGKMRIVFASYHFSFIGYLKKVLAYIVVIIVAISVIFYVFPSTCENFFAFIIRGILCVMLFGVSVIIFGKTKEFNEMLKVAKTFIKI